MNDFVFCAPTKVYFGKNAEENVGDILTRGGYKKVLMLYGGQSALNGGLIVRLRWELERADIKYCEFGGIKPNPRLSAVRDAIELAKRERAQLILAVGGGSVIDTAKAVGIGVACGGDVWDFYCKKRVPDFTLPVGVVLTIAASGSEMSNSSVITNDSTNEKRGLNCELTRPVFAVMNPELTATVPAFQTACGCADIFMHTAERYLSAGGAMGITDSIAEALMRTVIARSKVVMRDPGNYEARADLMWAGSLSHNGLTGCGTDGGDWAVHSLGHEISALYDTAHGAALTAVWGSWARYVYKNCLNRFHLFAVQVMGERPYGTRDELALKGITVAEEWFKSMGLPTSIKELGVDPADEELRLMAKKCASGCGGVKGSCLALHEEDMYKIYLAAKQ